MRSVLLWVLAVIVTLAAVVYQRMIGPTRPVRGTINVASTEIPYKLSRSHGGPEDHQVSIRVPNPALRGHLYYQRYKTTDPWTRVEMARRGEELVGALPHQPPGGKLLYQVRLTSATEPPEESGTPGRDPSRPNAPSEVSETPLPAEGPVVIRFRGGVPGAVMIPHILLMFIAMLWSNRTGIEALRPEANPRRLAYWTLGLMAAGGLIFGPAVQWFAFGEWWTGVPFGYDLTDNKTLIAVIAWIVAVIAGRRSRRSARGWTLAAAIVTLVIYLIPHSVLGTELDYSQIPAAMPPTGR